MPENTLLSVSEGGKPWVANYSPNFEEHVDYKKSTMYELLVENAKNYPDYQAYDFLGTVCDYKSMIQQIDIVARALTRLGVRTHDVITICLPNTPHSLLCFYAANKLGCVANMIHPLSPANELKYFIDFGESDWLVILDAFLPAHHEMLQSSRIKKTIVCSVPDYLPLVKKIGFNVTSGRKIEKVESSDYIQWDVFFKSGESDSKEYIRPFSPDAAAVYLHSGGTTGSPKTIKLSSNNFNMLGLQGPGILNLKKDQLENSSMLCILPMFHGFGLCMSVHTMLILGFKCILVPQFNAEVMAENIIKKKPNYLAGVPTLFESIIRNKKLQKADLSCLKGVFCGGDSLPTDTKNSFDAFIKERGSETELREGYGLTETVTVCCVNQIGSTREGSVGLPLGETLMKIVDTGTKLEIPYGTEGEICVSGPTVMLGYLKDEEETSNTIQLHKDGHYWVHTGDYGHMDTDGFVYFKQRLKRIIKCSGYPVFPSQVEDRISEIEEVENVCVIGIPDDYQMERVKAFITVKDGVKADDQLIEKIKDHCMKSFAKWSVPSRWEFRDELPRTKVGKIDYITLTREIAENAGNK